MSKPYTEVVGIISGETGVSKEGVRRVIDSLHKVVSETIRNRERLILPKFLSVGTSIRRGREWTNLYGTYRIPDRIIPTVRFSSSFRKEHSIDLVEGVNAVATEAAPE